jgi:cytidylate kinase
MSIIAISRGTFSGGKIIAEELARRLDYPCVSREIHCEAAKEFGIPEAELNAGIFSYSVFEKMSQDKRIAILNSGRASLLKLSNVGNLIYHGLAVHLLLSGVTHVLRVRVIAGMEYRIKAAMELRNATHDEATAIIRNDDKENAYWSRFLYDVDWQDPSLYDVIINLDKISINSAVETLIQMSKLEDFRPNDASQQALNNLLLGSVVWTELSKDPRTRSANVRVVANDGSVTIYGDAKSEQIINDIITVAGLVTRVREVNCEVGVGSNWFW